jgi:hypothetical protein
MDDSKRDEGHEKKIKYVRPELISLDKDKGAEGGIAVCNAGSGAGVSCNPGAGGIAPG